MCVLACYGTSLAAGAILIRQQKIQVVSSFFLLGLTDFYKVGVLRIAFGQRARAQRGKRIDVAAYVDDITVLVDRRVPSALRNAHNARHNS